MMNLTKYWKENATKANKHFVGELTTAKKKTLRKRFKKHLLDQININKIKLAVDWGCGGGLLAKETPKEWELVLVDICADSLMRASSYIDRDATLSYYSDHSTYKHKYSQPDLLWCYSVIHLFPSLDYFKAVCNLWDEIAPKRIAIKTKVGPSNITSSDYDNDPSNALILDQDTIVSSFPKYEIEYLEIEKISKSWDLIFLILERK